MKKILFLLLSISVFGQFGYQGGGGSSTPPANGLIVAASGGQYTTIQSAINAASAGQTVIVYPGTYNEQIDMKTGVHLYFMPGARHTYNITGTTTYAIKFSTSGNIYGKGTFSYTGTQTGSNYVFPIWLGYQNTSKTYFEADSLYLNVTYSAATYCAGIWVGGNYDTCIANVREISTNISAATMAGDDGSFCLYANKIRGVVNSEGIIKLGGYRGSFTVEADIIQNTGTGHLLTVTGSSDSTADTKIRRANLRAKFGQGMIANYGGIVYSHIDSLRIENDQGVGYVTYNGVGGKNRVCSTFVSGNVIYNNSTNGGNTYCLKIAGGGYIESTVARLINRDTTLCVVKASREYSNAQEGKILIKNATIKTINPATGDVNTYGKAICVEDNGVIELWNCRIFTGSSSPYAIMKGWGVTTGGSVLWGTGNAINRASLTYQTGITDTWGTGSNVLLITDSSFK